MAIFLCVLTFSPLCYLVSGSRSVMIYEAHTSGYNLHVIVNTQTMALSGLTRHSHSAPPTARYASPTLLATPPRPLTSALSNAKRSRAAVRQRAITRCPLALGWSLRRVGAHTRQPRAGAYLGPTRPKVLGFASTHGSLGRGVACELSTPCHRRCAFATAAHDSCG